jgi:drug/metabolite transporter (DMT)-like permease
MGIGEFYALLCAVLWGSSVVLFKHAGNSMSANSLNLIKNCIGTVLLIPTALLVEGFELPSLSTTDWLLVAGTGFFGIAVADSWYLQALRHLGAGRTAIVGSLYSPFVVILSIVILGEKLDWWKWSGFVLVITGVFTVVYQRHYQTVDREDLTKGLSLAASSVLLTALGVVLMKPVLDNAGFFWIISLRLLAGTVGLILYLLVRDQLFSTISIVRHGDHKWKTIITASVVGTYLAMIFWLAGFKYADASVASVLNETSNIFIVLMAWLFLKEDLGVRKVIGMAIAFSGVIIFVST